MMTAKGTSHYIDSGDAEIHVEQSGEGPPILLIHGWPLDSRIFTPQVPALGKHFTVITYDRRGFGKSSGRPDLRCELDDIDRILDDCTKKAVHVLGMSQGGRIALRYAITRKERLSSLILQGAVIDGYSIEESPEESIPISEYSQLVRNGHLDEFRKRWLRHPMMENAGLQEDEASLVEHILNDYDGRDLKIYSPDIYQFSIDVLASLERLTIPTLILTGAQETDSRREHARKLTRLIPGAREVILSRSGHLSNLTEPGVFNQAVIEFCSCVDAGLTPDISD